MKEVTQTPRTKTDAPSGLIMPDGRPLFAWENELKMLRNEINQMNSQLREFALLKESLRFTYEIKKDMNTLDTIIRIKQIDAVLVADFWENLRQYLHMEK